MTLRVSYFVAAFALLSLGSSNVRVNAQDCTEEEQAYIGDHYSDIEAGLASICNDDVCSFSCQDQLESSAATLANCIAADGYNYYEMLTSDYACEFTETTEEPTADDTCSDEVNTESSDDIVNADLQDCHYDNPCTLDCYVKLDNLISTLPYCRNDEGTILYDYYLSFRNQCAETTPSPAVTTAAPSTGTTPSASTSTSTTTTTTTTSAPSTTNTDTDNTSGDSTGTSPSTTDRTTSSETSEEEEEEETTETSASTAGSASDNGAASVGSSAIGSLVVAGTLALLAVQS